MSDKTLTLFGQILAITALAFACLLMICPPDERPFLQEKLANYKINLGLDLKGGSELLYEINPEEIDPSKNAEDVIDDTKNIISQRIFESGIVKEPRVQKEQENRIIIQLPGLSKQDTEQIKKVIQEIGTLEWRLVASPEVGIGDEKLTEASEKGNYETAKAKGERALARYVANLKQKGYRWYPDKNGNHDYLLWVKDPYNITGKRLSSVKYDGLTQVIHFNLKAEAAKDFDRLTTKYTKQSLAIIFNDKVVAAPVIQSRIQGGSGILENFSYQEAQNLIKTLRSGSLEIQPELLHENTIGPSLGEDSVRLGINAGIFGLCLVVGFIVIYYLAAGIVASIALALNVLIVFAILVVFRETLTLPGIAGLILTVGMSIDANIIIFERIREEKLARLGNDPNKKITKEELLADVETGFKQAFSTILDANLTTFLTAAILYYIATGAVQGFAFTMLWGIVASFFTAIFVTRTLINFLIQVGVVRNLGMMQALKDPKFDLTGKMRLAGILSMITVVLSVLVFYSSSDRVYGLDMRGGVLAQISLQKPLPTEEVRNRLRDDFRDDLEVQHIVADHLDGSSQNGWYEFSVRLPNVHHTEIEAIDVNLNQLAGEMALLNRKLKDTQRDIIREEQDKDEVLKQIKNLKNQGGDDNRDDLTALREKVRSLNDVIKDYTEKEQEYQKEIDVIRDKRRVLVQDKNEKAGIDELRDKINTKFSDELAPFPFGDIEKVTSGKYRNYFNVPVNLRTPVSISFLQDTLSKVEQFDKVVVAVNAYDIKFQISKDGQAEKIQETIAQHFELARPSLKPNPFEIKEAQGIFTTSISFADAAPVETVNDAIAKCNFENVTVSVKGVKEDLLTHVNLLIDLPTDKRNETQENVVKYIEAALRDTFDSAKFNGLSVYLSDPFPRFSQISGVVAKAQKASAYRAITLSLILILLYIAVRFPNGWRFGFAAVVALVHDVAITLGAIVIASNTGLVNVEINLPVIAALLTIVGYSLNDTIVIFDRLRENQMKEEVWDRLGFKKVVAVYNNSINQTLSRTILTSFTTFVVVAIIFALNYGRGSVMEGFSFTLIIGIIVGTYSSIFVASSVVLRMEAKHRQS